LASGSKTGVLVEGQYHALRKIYGKWEQLIQALVKHWTNRYGVDESQANGLFEVWNEPET